MKFRNLSRGLALGLTASAIFAIAQASADDRGSVTGVVKNAAGTPVAGAFVKLKNADKRLTFMVVSQDKGAFTASDLPAGRYTVQGVGGGMVSKMANVDVAAGKPAMSELSLVTAQAPMIPASWPGRVPEAEIPKLKTVLPDGPGKELAEAKCTVCHDAQRINAKYGDHHDWEHTVGDMRINMVGMKMPDLTEAENKTIVDYLTATFKPAHPYDSNARLPRSFATGKGMHFKVVTYDLANRDAEPHDIAVDPSGIAWAAERAGKLIRFDPKALEFTERDIPPGAAPADRQRLGNPQIDSKGMLWAADGPNARWLSYDTVKRQFHAYPWPSGHGNAGGNTMAIAADGKVWATGGGGVRSFDPATVEFKFYTSPTKGAGAYGMAMAGDGSAWWAEDSADKMARADPKTGEVTEYKIPYDGHAFPRRMNSDWDGNLWVGLWNGGSLMKVDYKTKKMTLYTPPTPNGGEYSTVADKKNHLIWVSEHEVDKIARFDPATNEWVEFPLPDAVSDPRRIEIDPTNPNRIFFSGNIPARIGYVEYLP